MKNMSKRTKMLLAIAGVVIVVIVAGLVVLGPGEEGLFGTTVFHISPQNPTISVGQVINMSINSWGVCTFECRNANIASFQVTCGTNAYGVYGCSTSSAVINTKSVKVLGVSPGQTTIIADCQLMNRSTTVTVR